VIKQIHDKKGDTVNIAEVAAGTGFHALSWANQWPYTRFYITDYSDDNVKNIRIRVEDAEHKNIAGVEQVDIRDPTWKCPIGADLFVAVNLTHISPYEATEGLFQVASRHNAMLFM
jgi:methylase of polypeptide subunit release factors